LKCDIIYIENISGVKIMYNLKDYELEKICERFNEELKNWSYESWISSSSSEREEIVQSVLDDEDFGMFSEEELDSIMEYFDAKKVFSNPKSTQKKKDDAKKKCEGLVEQIKPLMQRALDVVKENALDLEKEFGYTEPDAEKAARGAKWLRAVQSFNDPQTYVEQTQTKILTEATPTEATPAFDGAEDLPFPASDEAEDLPF
jgi:hypothetical protein